MRISFAESRAPSNKCCVCGEIPRDFYRGKYYCRNHYQDEKEAVPPEGILKKFLGEISDHLSFKRNTTYMPPCV